ncbi:hypothetical protein HKX48_005782 [Thoreauomyces humboldtii]|nr:hypothetical protein HKX48_005782 [Thoreauomyces humboldtii]
MSSGLPKSESAVSLASNVTIKTESLDHSEGGNKFKVVFGLLKKLVGVKDISNMRLSLPASLLEPESNLEFWNYLDRPDYFVSIPDGDTPLERMLRVIRWWYSKDTKWKDTSLRKPYNSCLGERFLCWWDVPKEANGSVVSSSTADASTGSPADTLKVTCITEQISHHPPVSAYYYACKEKGIIGRGVDHIAARFTGTNIKVGPGSQNRGIFITLQSHDGEEYNIQHPWASVTGWLSGSPYIVVGESAIITCPKTGLKAVLEYKDEPTFGKPRFAIEGKVFRYDYASAGKQSEKEQKDSEKLSKIPDADVVCRLNGQWNGQIYAATDTSAAASPRLLFDMKESEAAVKNVLPLVDQDPLESRRLWEAVTVALVEGKDGGLATSEKRRIEDLQRAAAADREKTGVPFESHFFEFKGPRDAKIGPPADMDCGKPFLKAGAAPAWV